MKKDEYTLINGSKIEVKTISQLIPTPVRKRMRRRIKLRPLESKDINSTT